MDELVRGPQRWVLGWIGLGLGCNDSAGDGPPDDPTGTTGAATSTADGTDAGVTSSLDSSSASGGTDTGIDSSTAGATDSDDPPATCPDDPGGLALDESCSANAECASLICRLYTDAPPDLEAVCVAPPPSCGVRITGTTLDIVTRQPVAGIQGQVATFLGVAMPIVATVSDDQGRVDAVTPGPIDAGLVILQEGRGFTLTGSPLNASAMANEIHDVWVVSNDAAAAWSAMLSTDPEIPVDALPLGAAGGMVGLVRDAAGQPVVGATIASTDEGSGTIIRYLAADGAFDATATGELGLFVILAPGLAEQFEVTLGGEVVGAGTGGSAAGVIWAFVLTVP